MSCKLYDIKQLIARAPNPFELDASTHALATMNFNRELRGVVRQSFQRAELHDCVRTVLQDAVGFERDLLAIHEFCVGSDGRQEKGVFSPMELSVYIQYFGKKVPVFLSINELESTLNQEFQRLCGSEYFSRIELKFAGRPVSTCRNSKELWPDRVLDSLPILQDEGMTPLAPRLMLLYEMIDELGGKAIDDLRMRISGSKRISSSGSQTVRGSPITHFSWTCNEAYFDGARSRIAVARGSFKQGPLRLAQAGVNREIIRAIRNSPLGEALFFITRMPSSIPERLSFMRACGVLNERVWNEGAVQRFSDNYRFFLRLYHQSEFTYVNNECATVIPFDHGETQERMRELIAAISELPNLKSSISPHVNVAHIINSILPFVTRHQGRDLFSPERAPELFDIIREFTCIDPVHFEDYFAHLPKPAQQMITSNDQFLADPVEALSTEKVKVGIASALELAANFEGLQLDTNATKEQRLNQLLPILAKSLGLEGEEEALMSILLSLDPQDGRTCAEAIRQIHELALATSEEPCAELDAVSSELIDSIVDTFFSLFVTGGGKAD